MADTFHTVAIASPILGSAFQPGSSPSRSASSADPWSHQNKEAVMETHNLEAHNNACRHTRSRSGQPLQQTVRCLLGRRRRRSGGAVKLEHAKQSMMPDLLDLPPVEVDDEETETETEAAEAEVKSLVASPPPKGTAAEIDADDDDATTIVLSPSPSPPPAKRLRQEVLTFDQQYRDMYLPTVGGSAAGRLAVIMTLEEQQQQPQQPQSTADAAQPVLVARTSRALTAAKDVLSTFEALQTARRQLREGVVASFRDARAVRLLATDEREGGAGVGHVRSATLPRFMLDGLLAEHDAAVSSLDALVVQRMEADTGVVRMGSVQLEAVPPPAREGEGQQQQRRRFANSRAVSQAVRAHWKACNRVVYGELVFAFSMQSS